MKMENFINGLLSKEKSLDEVEKEFLAFARSNDKDVYSFFTENDLSVRDEFESYIKLSKDFDELSQKWLNR